MPANFLIPQTRINNLVANLKTLQDNIDAIQLDLQDLHQTITQEIGQAITDLQGLISTETNRATEVEGQLSNLTTDSKTNLVSAINEVDSHTDTNTTNLSNEITRATTAEGTLTTNLANEVTRATTAEGKKVDKVSTVNRVYGTDSSGNQTTYANSSFVHTSGNETVGGNKTFSGITIFTTDTYAQKSGNFGALHIKNTNYDYLTNPSAAQYQHIVWKDKNNKDMSYVQQHVNTDGIVSFYHVASNYKTDGTRVNCVIGCYVNRDGSIWTYAPTPTENTTSSNQIDTVGSRNTALGNYATVTSLNNKIQKVASLPSNQETGVLYCIPE